MKKLLYSLLTLAAALTVASCQKEQPTSSYGDGDAVNASFAVSMSDALTKAFADGTTVDTVDAALYEVGGTNDAPTYTFITEADPATIANLKAKVEINGKLKKGKQYRVVFWASKKATTGAETTSSPYTVAWDPAPVVTVTPTGDANDEARDAFFGTFDTGVVTGDVTTEKDIPLVRPFAQVNVLVPGGNIADGASISSSMTVKQAPTTLNLNTGETDTPADYVFAVAPMAEPAFGGYAQSHKYVAMNYVLVDQDATASHYYDVSFSVTAGDDSTGDTPKSLTIPLKANVRTNIVGNIFESFGFSGGVVVTPDAGEVVTTDIRIAVGTAGTSADDPIPVSSNGEMVTFAISRDVTGETPAITYDPEGIVTATWNAQFKGIEIVPQVENGSTVVTVTFAEVTKTTYSEGKVDVYVKVGNGQNTKKDVTIDITLDKTEITVGEEVGISARATVEGEDVVLTPLSWSSSDAAVTVTPGDETTTATLKGVSAGSATITVTYAGDATYNEATASVDVTVSEEETEYDFTTIAELKALNMDTATEYSGKLTNAVVTFVPDAKDAFIKDATGSILLYKDGHGLKQGQTYTGDVTVTATLFKKLRQITAIDATFTGDETVVEPETVTLAQIAADYDTYESAYVKVVGMTSGTTTTAKGNINVTQDNTSYIVYTNVAIPVNTGDVFTAEGTITRYNDTYELKVWDADGLTVTTAAPALTASPATATVNADVTSVEWTITSNTSWTISAGEGVTATPASGTGNGTVTLSFAANTSTAAATYTATASATGCDDVTITITQNGAGTSTTTAKVVIADYATANNWENSTQYTSVTLDDNITATAAGGGNTGKYYSNGSDWRFYQNEGATLTIAAKTGKELVSVKLKYTVSSSGQLSYGESVVTSETAVSVSGSSAVFSVGNSGTATNGQVRFTEIEVIYK